MSAEGLSFSVAFIAPSWLWRTRAVWCVDFTRDYLPEMSPLDERRWWTVARWHRLQIGPLVLMWRRPTR